MIRRIIMLVCVMAVATLSLLCPPAGATGKTEFQYPFQDYRLPVEKRVADLVSRLTLEEKVKLLSETSEGIPRLGVPEYHFGNEALHGVVRPGTFTVFPMAIALSATWDPALIHEVSTAISDEARGKNNLFHGQIKDLYSGLLAFWSPTVNMARDPRWGRTPETYGEDPWLTGRIGVAFVTGLQGNDPKYIKVISTPKHFAANNEEHNRFECNARISERMLREYYLPGFKACVTEGNAQSVMGAYNAINGIPCNANKKLLTDILRKEWKFDGYVVTDCGALSTMISGHKYAKDKKESATFAIHAGVDLECGGERVLTNYLIPALKDGMVTEADIDQAVSHVLRGRFRVGMFDPPEVVPYSKIPPSVVGSKEHQQLARKTARESFVLLKNDKAGGAPLLPIDVKKVRSIAVTGPNAAICRFGDYSGSPVNPPVTPLEGIRNRAGDRLTINYAEWVAAPGDKDFTVLTADNLLSGSPGFNAEYFANSRLSGTPKTTRDDQKIDLDTLNHPPDPAIPGGNFSVRWKGTLTAPRTGSYIFAFTVDGGGRLTLDGKTLMERTVEKPKAFRAGQAFDLDKATRSRVERMTATVTLEGGKSYPIEAEYRFVEGGNALARLEWISPSEEKAAARARELETIRNSDMAVVFLGIGLDQEREGKDRDDMNLPKDQEEYIRQAVAANPKTVVVLISGSPLSVNWIAGNVPAIVEAWYPGEQGGNAIADVLFGDYNPAGRTPVSFYKSVEELPPFDDYEVWKGRTYMYMKNAPLFPFGHGLSYTTFSYGPMQLSRKTAKDGDKVVVNVRVKNTGARDGEEVVQLYAHNGATSVVQPRLQLKAFKRVSIRRGQTVTVSLPLAVKDLGYWNDAANHFVVAPGAYDLMVGASSGDIRSRGKLKVVP